MMRPTLVVLFVLLLTGCGTLDSVPPTPTMHCAPGVVAAQDGSPEQRACWFLTHPLMQAEMMPVATPVVRVGAGLAAYSGGRLVDWSLPKACPNCDAPPYEMRPRIEHQRQLGADGAEVCIHTQINERLCGDCGKELLPRTKLLGAHPGCKKK